MLKRFFLNILSSFVGAWAAIILFIVGLIIFILGMVGVFTRDDSLSVKPHTIMKIVLAGEIQEAETGSFDYTMLLTGKIEKAQTLKNILEAIDNAKTNGDIDALLIECQGVSAPPATLDAIRNAIKDFKKSGKRVFAYGDYLTMGDYYVACTADAVYLNPAGSLDLHGLGGTSLYYKDLLDKLGIDVEAVRVGTYKSAIEPYTSNEMSEAAKLQLDSLYTDMWQYILKGISADRNVPVATIDSLVNNFISLDQASIAKNYKLVDDCLYYRQVEKIMAEYVGKDVEDLNIVVPDALVGMQNGSPESDDQIAVVYASGDIAEYEGAGINCHELVPVIVHLAENEKVKGMVLRVNSPGGSVFGSEQIGEALDYFKSKGKPLAVSMGDYAASGGYWISAGADIIYADPLTITGSIGIFGLVPNVSKLAANIGVHPQTVSTNPGVQFPSIFYPMTPEQYNALQANIERGYEKFINRVASGRHKPPEYIKTIAEGRVWGAIKAQELGLVDKLGGLSDAIEWVKSKASISKPVVVDYPKKEQTFLSMLSSSAISKSPELQAVVDRLSTPQYDEKIISLIEWFLLQNHMQARSPYYKISLN